ncbi:RNA pseudouridine synthase [Tissierella sp. P1]|jgi:23S rRNA pseudouridine1911/1915/1917 synthase|uniref:RluA family pseudouridine synthase n=1 Tax=unclassified Tissierella TaxID=2638726 RepID=UPI000BA15C4E|nr:RluA family pseudouridine synthase [Tissierella sp. P1]MDU5083148.1 RluA family pseudouridine synthase [Bacillota bacterium]OZV12845.1 RNA pseudouridine synthase [Tissierella sp. P1]
MDIVEFYVDEDDNERLDAYLAKELDEISRSYIQKLIKEDLVYVNDKHVKSSYLVKEGDYIKVNLPEPKILEIIPEDIPIDIVYEDEDVAIINKPQDMVVHPAPGNYTGTLVNALLFHIDNLSSINGIIRPGIVHRLDKDTSGLLIIAKNDKAHRILSESLKERNVKRVYISLVHGILSDNEGTVNAPIGRHGTDRKKMTVTQKNSKEAITHYKVLERYDNYSLVEVNLETGRTHQIRVHMAYINHPVVGDPVYSKGKNEFGLDKQMLHAYKLGFSHPSTGEHMEFQIDLPEYFKNILDTLENKRK